MDGWWGVGVVGDEPGDGGGDRHVFSKIPEQVLRVHPPSCPVRTQIFLSEEEDAQLTLPGHSMKWPQRRGNEVGVSWLS